MLKILLFTGFFTYAAVANDYQYLGKCSWDITTSFEYSPGFALAEFFLHRPSGKVFVNNRIDTEGGDFRETPLLPPLALLQEAGVQGTRGYTWDEGASKINFIGRPMNQVHVSTDSVNSLGSNGNVYAPCFFIAE